MEEAALSNLTHSLLVLCCNGGLPIVDLHVWPLDGGRFHAVDPTEWVARATTAEALNGSAQLSSIIPSLLGDPDCQPFNLSFADPASRAIFRDRNGSLACRCPRGFYGSSCQRQLSPIGADGSSSFTMFLLLVLIPLSIGIIAAIGGLLCKLCCCCDCFGGCALGRDEEDPLAKDEDFWERRSEGEDPARENAFNRCLETGTTTSSASSTKSSHPYSVLHIPTLEEMEPNETSSFLPISATPASRHPFARPSPLLMPQPVPRHPHRLPPPPRHAATQTAQS